MNKSSKSEPVTKYNRLKIEAARGKMSEQKSTVIKSFPMNFPESSKYIRKNELKACKSCGGEATIVSHYIKGVANRINYFVKCPICRIRTRDRKNEVGAIEDWNNWLIQEVK